MSSIAIHVENLGKQYRIGERERSETLRDALVHLFDSPRRKFKAWRQHIALDETRWIWALYNVSFEIRHGEAIGIIGRNGAGKTTLLKILARITEPTEGFAQIRGRIGSLLEVGTGFHPELTGRENIFLNGAILGMPRIEIQRKFDEIVAFAEVADFIDTPVKHYSSGMYMRLAFAVAAHLETEILLVDEVLAVGDAAFQKKCLGKMGDVTKAGRTVLFVSHNLGAIAQLCPRSVLLRGGQVEAFDRSDLVITRYLSEYTAGATDIHLNPQANPLTPAAFVRLWLADTVGNPINVVDVTKRFSIGLQIRVYQEIAEADVSLRFLNALGQALFTTNVSDQTQSLADLHPGEYAFLIQIPNHFFAPGTYSFIAALHRPGVQLFDLQDSKLSFQVIESGSSMWQYHGQAYGNIFVDFPWQPIQPPRPLQG